MDPNLQAVLDYNGIVFMGGEVRLLPTGNPLAMDAQTPLLTTPNSGIPAFLSTYIDPKLIEFAVAPNKATKIVGSEVKKGDWTLETAMFPVIEYTGQPSAYGDYSPNGVSGANVNWEQRQSFTYQLFCSWGERELEKMGLAKIDLASRKKTAAVNVLNKFQNKTYFLGVSGLMNYGLLNDPALAAPITPLTVSSATTWAQKSALGDPGALAIYNDVKAMVVQIITQANGTIELDEDTPMTLVTSPALQVQLTTANTYGNTPEKLIKANYPNMKFEVAVEYATASGGMVQLIANKIDGQDTAETAFTEKLRAHPMVIESSSFKQKFSQGSWGTIIYRPLAIVGMLGV